MKPSDSLEVEFAASEKESFRNLATTPTCEGVLTPH